MSNNAPISGEVNIADLNNAVQQTLIHIDLNKTFYSISPLELDNIEEGSSTIWKDVTLTSLGLGVPCTINGIIEFNKANLFNTEIFLNSLIGAVAIIIAVIFGILWYRSTDKCKVLIAEIKQRPQYKMP